MQQILFTYAFTDNGWLQSSDIIMLHVRMRDCMRPRFSEHQQNIDI